MLSKYKETIKMITEEQFVDMVINSGIILETSESEFNIELDSGIQNVATYASAGDLAPYLGWTIFVSGLGEVILTTAGIVVGTVVVWKVGSWAWNKVVNFINNNSNLTPCFIPIIKFPTLYCLNLNKVK